MHDQQPSSDQPPVMQQRRMSGPMIQQRRMSNHYEGQVPLIQQRRMSQGHTSPPHHSPRSYATPPPQPQQYPQQPPPPQPQQYPQQPPHPHQRASPVHSPRPGGQVSPGYGSPYQTPQHSPRQYAPYPLPMNYVQYWKHQRSQSLPLNLYYRQHPREQGAVIYHDHPRNKNVSVSPSPMDIDEGGPTRPNMNPHHSHFQGFKMDRRNSIPRPRMRPTKYISPSPIGEEGHATLQQLQKFSFGASPGPSEPDSSDECDESEDEDAPLPGIGLITGNISETSKHQPQIDDSVVWHHS